MREARAAGTGLLVEATSNQVNQFGGYTGMRPADFVRFLHDIAVGVCFPADAAVDRRRSPRSQCLACRAC